MALTNNNIKYILIALCIITLIISLIYTSFYSHLEISKGKRNTYCDAIKYEIYNANMSSINIPSECVNESTDLEVWRQDNLKDWNLFFK